jgi:hypothetical protein
MPWIGMPAAGMSRCGSTSCSKHSCRRSLPATMRVAPIWMISSPWLGFRPVVSVSNTVKASSVSGGRPARRRRRGREEVEVVVLGPAVAVQQRAGRIDGRAFGRQRQQEAEEGLVAHPFALEPEGAAVALHHVAHRQRAGLAGRR